MDTKVGNKRFKKILVCRKISPKPTTIADNAKVKVQYIQEPATLQKHDMETLTHINVVQRDSLEELENVEYLDDDDEYATVISHKNFKEEDPFYPNAIQCLLALYAQKYKEISQIRNAHEIEIRFSNIWNEISKGMNESFFKFNSAQVKTKFTQLRKQYLHISNKIDVRTFQYFDQLHEIYNNNLIEAISSGDRINFTDFCSRQTLLDDVLFQEKQASEDGKRLVKLTNPKHGPVMKKTIKLNTRDEPLVAKDQLSGIEPKTMKLELQTVTDKKAATSTVAKNKISETIDISKEEQNVYYADDLKSYDNSNKRIKLNLVVDETIENAFTPITDDTPTLETLAQIAETRQQEESHDDSANGGIKSENVTCLQGTGIEFTLADYNEAQERRHQEQMQIMRESLILQERAIEVQTQFIEQLIRTYRN